MNRQCSVKQHAQFVQDKPFKVYRISSKKQPKVVHDTLLKLGLLKPKSTYICSACITYTKEHLIESTSSPLEEAINTIKSAVHARTLSPSEILSLCEIVGTLCSYGLIDDANRVAAQYNEANFFNVVNHNEWLRQRHPPLLHFLLALMGIDMTAFEDNLSGKSIRILCATVENLLFLQSPAIVTPFSFVNNLISYFVSGSKTAHNLHSSCSPCGSYTTLQKWIDRETHVPNAIPVTGSCALFFDNNQVLQKNWRIVLNFKTKCSVITNCVAIHNPFNSVQSSVHLSPFYWLHRVTTDIPGQLKSLSHSCVLSLKPYKFDFMKREIMNVLDSISSVDGKLIDSISAGQVEVAGSSSFKTMADPYAIVESHHPPSPPSLILADPVMVNPSAYESLKQILQSLQSQACVGSGREWVVVGCDGSPYNLVARMIDDWFLCPICSLEVRSGVVTFLKHMTSLHANFSIKNEECRMFKHIVLVPGAGHIEMNILKSVFKLLWEPFLKYIAVLCGFRTPHALAFAQSASNHHKSWQFLLIFLHATLREVIYEFLTRNQTEADITLDTIASWISRLPCTNYHFLWNVIQEWVLPLFLYRCGVRRNNPRITLAARDSASTILYGTNSTTYMELLYRDEVMRLSAPENVLNFLHHVEILSASGHPSKGEGGDFILEAKNRRVKMWIPPGVPSERTWLRSCRNLDRLEEIKKTTFSHCELDTDASFYTTDDTSLEGEIAGFRSWIRQSGYLSSPDTRKPLTGLDQVALDPVMERGPAYCQENRATYRTSASVNMSAKKMRLRPLFVKAEERVAYEQPEKRTVTELVSIIASKLASDTVDQVLKNRWTQIAKKGNKADILAFLLHLNNSETSGEKWKLRCLNNRDHSIMSMETLA